jgi:hypothetical protein
MQWSLGGANQDYEPKYCHGRYRLRSQLISRFIRCIVRVPTAAT